MGRRLKLRFDTGSCGDLLEPHLALGPAQLPGGKFGFFSSGEKGLEMHLRAPFFPLFLKAQPPNAARKASLLQTIPPPPAAVSQALVSFTGQGTLWAQLPPGRAWPILNQVSNKSQRTHDSDAELFMRRASFYSPHSSFFFSLHHRLPLPGRWDGFPPRSPQSIYPWNAVASGRFLPFKLCTKFKSAAQNTKFGLWAGD